MRVQGGARRPTTRVTDMAVQPSGTAAAAPHPLLNLLACCVCCRLPLCVSAPTHFSHARLVKRAMHGTRMMSWQEIRQFYGREVVNLRHEGRWVFLNTLFSVSEAVMYMQVCGCVCVCVDIYPPCTTSSVLGTLGAGGCKCVSGWLVHIWPLLRVACQQQGVSVGAATGCAPQQSRRSLN